MASEVLAPNEILLNSRRYKILGGLKRTKTSQFAQKTVIGEYSKDSMENHDTWVINDGTGGVLVEELDERYQVGRYWWGNTNFRFKGHMVLGDLETSITLQGWADPTGFVDGASAWSDEATAYDNSLGTWATAGAIATATWTEFLELTQTATNCSAVKVYANVISATGTPQIDVDVYYNSAWNDVFQGNMTRGAWKAYSLGDTYSVTAMRIRMYHNDGSGREHAVYEADFYNEGATPETTVKIVEFNNKVYRITTNTVEKLDSAGSTFEALYYSATAFVDAIASVNSCMYISVSGGNYIYVSTADVFTVTNVATADLWVEWDDKLWHLDHTTNTIYYAATPNSATPSWTANGVLDAIPLGNVEQLVVDVDADSNDIIYAATNNGVSAHDTTNAKWIKSTLLLPTHPNAGRGAIVWGDASYYPHGLGVTRYVADGYPAVIEEVGLDQDDGLPTEYVGEIVGSTPGFQAIYFLVDASQVTGTGYSTIMAYNSKGWYCKWEDSTADQQMNCALVSGVVAYRLWFSTGTTSACKVYYIPLERNALNPRRVNGKTYKAASTFYSPWFDADWQVGNKLALSLRLDVQGNVSADETVRVSYRTNHTNIDRDTGWTTLGSAITSAGETELLFPNSTTPAGTTFRAIQFKVALTRAGGSTTETPDIVYLALDYIKVIPISWGWEVLIDSTTENPESYSSEEQLDNLVTATGTETLLALVYEDTTKYVRITSIEFLQDTGEYPKGTVRVLMTEA